MCRRDPGGSSPCRRTAGCLRHPASDRHRGGAARPPQIPWHQIYEPLPVESRQHAGPRHDLLEHERSQPARLRVVAAAMIRVEKLPRPAERVLAPVCKGKGASLEAAGQEHRVMRDAAEREDHPHAGQCFELAHKVAVAGTNLLRQRLVAGWQAFNSVRNASVEKRQAIIDRERRRSARKAELIERFIEQNARKVAGEGAAGAIRAVQSRSEPHEQNARRIRSEGSHRARPVRGMACANVYQKRRKPRATHAACVVELAATAHRRGGGHRLLGLQRLALANCVSSVEPFKVVSDEVPALMTWVTSSKYPAPTSR